MLPVFPLHKVWTTAVKSYVGVELSKLENIFNKLSENHWLGRKNFNLLSLSNSHYELNSCLRCLDWLLRQHVYVCMVPKDLFYYCQLRSGRTITVTKKKRAGGTSERMGVNVSGITCWGTAVAKMNCSIQGKKVCITKPSQILMEFAISASWGGICSCYRILMRKLN